MASCDHDHDGDAPLVVIHNRSDLRRVERLLAQLIEKSNGLEQLIMATKEETLNQLAEVKSDLQRLVGDLQAAKDALLAAIEAGDMTEIKAAADELETLIEAASPEQTEPPVEPEPAP